MKKKIYTRETCPPIKRLESLKEKIDKEVDFVGIRPYSHNIIGLTLLKISQEFGKAEANQCIDEFGLKKLGWSKVKGG